MSVIQCLLDKVKAGTVSQRVADKIAKKIEELTEALETGVGVSKNAQTELEASQKAFDILTKRINQKVRETAMHLDLVKRGLERFEKGAPVKHVLKSFSFTDEANAIKGGYLGTSAMEQIEFRQNMFNAQAYTVLEALDPATKGTFRDPAKLMELRKDMFALMVKNGTRSNDPEVRAISEAIQELTDVGGKAFAKAGGDITNRADYVLGRTMQRDKLLKYSEDEYVADSLKAFNLQAASSATDGFLSTPDKLVEAFRRDYRSVLDGGITDLETMAPKGLRSLVNSRNHARIFQFKDAQAMDEWTKKYGVNSIYQNVADYAQRIGRDIGILETYGPKPEAFIRTMLTKAAEIDPVATAAYKNNVSYSTKFVTGQWDNKLDPTISKWSNTYGNINVAAKLGSTVVDAIMVETMALGPIASKMRGLPVFKQLANDLKLFFGRDIKANRLELARLGIMTEGLVNDAVYGLRSAELEGTHGFSAKAARFVMKWSGLNRKTLATKEASALTLGDFVASTEWKDLPPEFVRWSKAHGMTEDIYKTIREVGKSKHENYDIDLISPYKLASMGKEKEGAVMATLYNRFSESVSPVSAPEVRAAFASIERQNRAFQVAAGSAKRFTGYLSSIINGHFKVIKAMPGYGPKIKYMSATIIGMTTAYLASDLVRQMLNGQDPRLDDASIFKALGKTIPIIGDMLFSDAGFGSPSLGGRLAGVAISDADKLAKAGANLAQGNTKQAGANAQQFMEALLPGRSLWYTQLILRRALLDHIRYLYDPDAEEFYKRRISKSEREGKPFWWEPNALSPSRMPNVYNVTEPVPERKTRNKGDY